MNYLNLLGSINHLLWMNCPLHFHLRVMISPAKNFPMKVICFVDTDNLFENYRHCNSDQRGNGAIFTCGGFSFATIWGVDSFLLFDPNG